MDFVPGNRTWRFPDIDRGQVRQLAERVEVPELIASIMLRRGLDEPDEARRFIRDDLRHIPDPRGLTDIERACHRIIKAMNQDSDWEHIPCYGKGAIEN